MSNHIQSLDHNLFIGSWHATNPDNLFNNDIQTVFHFGFHPDNVLDNISYHFIDLDDNTQSANKLFDIIIPEMLPKIHQSLQNGNTLVCCGMGKSRSVTLVTAYLIKYRNMTSEEALEFIKNRRPQINPNPEFLNKLKSWN